MPMDEPLRFGRTLDRLHDEGRLLHLFQPNNAPACGCKYYASSGATHTLTTESQLDAVEAVNAVCRRCLVIARKRLRARTIMAGLSGKLTFVKAGSTRPDDNIVSGHHRDRAAKSLSRKESE